MARHFVRFRPEPGQKRPINPNSIFAHWARQQLQQAQPEPEPVPWYNRRLRWPVALVVILSVGLVVFTLALAVFRLLGWL